MHWGDLGLRVQKSSLDCSVVVVVGVPAPPDPPELELEVVVVVVQVLPVQVVSFVVDDVTGAEDGESGGAGVVVVVVFVVVTGAVLDGGTQVNTPFMVPGYWPVGQVFLAGAPGVPGSGGGVGGGAGAGAAVLAFSDAVAVQVLPVYLPIPDWYLTPLTEYVISHLISTVQLEPPPTAGHTAELELEAKVRV